VQGRTKLAHQVGQLLSQA